MITGKMRLGDFTMTLQELCCRGYTNDTLCVTCINKKIYLNIEVGETEELVPVFEFEE